MCCLGKVARETMMLSSEMKSHLVDKLKDSAADGKTISRAYTWVGLGRVQSFMLILGRVGLGHFTCGSDWVGSGKLDRRPTLVFRAPVLRCCRPLLVARKCLHACLTATLRSSVRSLKWRPVTSLMTSPVTSLMTQCCYCDSVKLN